MKKQIKIIIVVLVIFIAVVALITPKARYYLRQGDVIMIAINMEKVEHALKSWSNESSGRFPRTLDERTKETNKKFLAFLSSEDWYEPPILPKREKWYKPIKERRFYRVVKFKPLLNDNIPDKVFPCMIYVYSDGVRYKIIGGDKEGFLVPEDITYERGASKPKIIYSDNYWK